MGRLIDADALIAQMEADAEQMEEPIAKMFTYAAINDVKHTPTIEPERKTGKWVPTEPDAPCFYRCDHCGRLLDFPECFCPTCGTDMRSEHED